jgi:hypothetical protein
MSMSSVSSTTSQRFKQQSILKSTVVTSKTEADKLDMAVGRFFFSTNTPFKAASNTYFKELIKQLHPGYKAPGRVRLGETILNRVHNEVEAENKTAINASGTLVILQDGWSNKQNDAIVAQSLTDGKTNYLLELVDAGSTQKTAQYCFELMEKAIDKIKNENGKVVFALCTDNENKMKALRDLVMAKYPNMVTYGCNSHYLNLVMGDIESDSVLQHVVQIQKSFKYVHVLHGKLKEKGGTLPVVPNKTRWNTRKDCLHSFKKNRNIYVEIRSDLLRANDKKALPDIIGKKVDDINILRNAEHLLEHMTKFSVALDRLQSDTCYLSSAVKIWKELLLDEVS